MSRIPTSEADRLSTAVQNGIESAHGPQSLRAEAAWNAVPGEEISVDFKDAGYEEIGGVETQPLKLGPVSHYGQVASVLESKPELSVDVYVNLPDGRTWNLSLAVPEGDEKLTAERLLTEISGHFDSVTVFLSKAITPARRAALGLFGLGPERQDKQRWGKRDE